MLLLLHLQPSPSSVYAYTVTVHTFRARDFLHRWGDVLQRLLKPYRRKLLFSRVFPKLSSTPHSALCGGHYPLCASAFLEPPIVNNDPILVRATVPAALTPAQSSNAL